MTKFLKTTIQVITVLAVISIIALLWTGLSGDGSSSILTTTNTGSAGSDGSDGSKGQKEQDGSTGDTGQKGEKGQTGAQGSAGNDGSDGSKGQKRQDGATGPQGTTGDKGQKGQTDGTTGDVTETITGKTQYSSSNTFLVVLGTGLILSLIISLLLFFALYKLYKWRIRIEGGRSIVLPEVHYEKIEAVEAGVQSIGGLIQEFGNYLSRKETETEKKFEEFLSLLSKLQNTVETQDAEIARLKEGYDNKLKKDSVMILLKLRDRVDYFINSETSSEDLVKASNGMLAIIDNELNAMDILSFDFDSGVSIREIDDFEIIETVETADPEKIGVVIRTIKNGYYMKGQDDEKFILREAEIKCYGQQDKEE